MNDDGRFSPCENQVAVGGPLEVTRGRERRLRLPSSDAGRAIVLAGAATGTRAAALAEVLTTAFAAGFGLGFGGGAGFFFGFGAGFFFGFGAGFAFGFGLLTFFSAFFAGFLAGFLAGFDFLAPLFFALGDAFFPFAFAISLSRLGLAEKMNGAV
jgi:hypothetical protein